MSRAPQPVNRGRGAQTSSGRDSLIRGPLPAMCLHGNNTLASFPVYVFFCPIINNSGIQTESLWRESLAQFSLTLNLPHERVGETPCVAMVDL